MTVAPSAGGDRADILAVARSTGVFTGEEVATVDELFVGYVRSPEVSGYNFLSYRQPETGRLVGFACWGPTALSHGATDLYWIATEPAAQGQGVAAALFRGVEAEVRAAGRWLIVIWTSSRGEYASARRFYQRMGCVESACLRDFYARGDDLMVYTRYLD